MAISRTQELAWFDEWTSDFMMPEHGLPSYEFMYRSSYRWVLAEIRRDLVTSNKLSVFAVLENFARRMEDAESEALSLTTEQNGTMSPRLVFGLAREIADIVLGFFDGKEDIYELHAVFEVDPSWTDAERTYSVRG